MSMIAQATTRWDGKVEIRFPFNRGLVGALKVHIPAHYREWNPELKVWIVASPWAPTAIGLLRSFFPDATTDRSRQAPPPDPTPIRPSDDAYRVLYLQNNAPDFIVEAVYRAIAREEHPDRKPVAERERAHERMIAVNRAIEVLRAKVAS